MRFGEFQLLIMCRYLQPPPKSNLNKEANTFRGTLYSIGNRRCNCTSH